MEANQLVSHITGVKAVIDRGKTALRGRSRRAVLHL